VTASTKRHSDISDGIDHVVNRVWPSSGEQFLDIATGTGWTARRLAARGWVVTGVDIGEGAIDAAKRTRRTAAIAVRMGSRGAYSRATRRCVRAHL
jgi:2-polyprenyl-3-methyl-5-hydroxy-6-metoxy-1,4-benzoquinol methylase